MSKFSESAGGIVINPHGQIVVTNQNNDSWSLPKGHIEENEDALQSAIREITEETGLTELDMVEECPSYTRYKIGKNGIDEDKSEQKKIHFFIFKTKQTQLLPQDPKHPEAVWMEIEKVADLLTHPKDKQFFQSMMPKLQELVTKA